MAKLIPLTQGKFAIVDDEDYERVSEFKWYVHRKKNESTEYARAKKTVDKKQYMLVLHRFVLMLKSGDGQVDHINRNGLDCRKSNLRKCTKSQNAANSKTRKPFRYKGVRYDGKYKKTYSVRITHNYKSEYVGRFDNEEDAARAYDKAAKKYFGEFAYLNFSDDDTDSNITDGLSTA